jgi:hypothetical protein
MGSLQPAYVDPDHAATLAWKACDDNGRVIEAWYALMESQRTAKYLYMDVGAGLLLFAATALLLSRYLDISNLQAIRHALSPRRRWHFLLIGIGALAWAWQAVIYSLILGREREYFPWCADSIGIPILGLNLSFIVLFLVSVTGGLLVMRWFGPLPAPLGAWDETRPGASWTISIVTAAFVLGVGVCAISAAMSELFGIIPACIVAVYLAASARAALLNRHNIAVASSAAGDS